MKTKNLTNRLQLLNSMKRRPRPKIHQSTSYQQDYMARSTSKRLKICLWTEAKPLSTHNLELHDLKVTLSVSLQIFGFIFSQIASVLLIHTSRLGMSEHYPHSDPKNSGERWKEKYAFFRIRAAPWNYSKTPIYRAPIYRVPRFTGPNLLPPKFSRKFDKITGPWARQPK